MGLKKLVNPGAFGQGADLWVIPDPAESAWARKIDWYLNFQVIRAAHHQTQQLPTPISEILRTNEIHLEHNVSVNEDSPLLVCSHQHLPAQFVVKVSYRGNNQKWMQQCLEIWERLKYPTGRFFLPSKLEESAFEKFWPNDKQIGISYVTDSSPVEA